MNIPEITKESEFFDFRNYDSTKNLNVVTLPDGTFKEYDKQSYGYISRTTPKNSYFTVIKKFYKDGVIKEKGLLFNSGGFKKGMWYYFDEAGKLIKEEDNDQPFKFSFLNLSAFLQTQKIPLTPGHIQGGYHTHIYNKVDQNEVIWIVQWLKDAARMPNIVEEIIVDGKSGNIKKKSNIEYMNN